MSLLKTKSVKIKEAISLLEKDENFKFLVDQYTLEAKDTTSTGKDKAGNTVFNNSMKQEIFKRSIADYVKHHFKILYKHFGKLDFIENYTEYKWQINRKSKSDK